jgi:hypothetical protein
MGLITTSKMESAVSAQIQSGRYADLSREEKAAWGVLTLIDEVRNGGFLQYFDNSSGEFSRDAVQSFIDLGASARVIEAVRTALSQFEGGAPSPDRTVRVAQVEKIDPSGSGNIFTPSGDVIFEELRVLVPMVHHYVWEKLPALRAMCHECTSAKLVSFFDRITDLLSQGTNVEIGGFGRFTAVGQSFWPSPELRTWIDDGEEPAFCASDLSKLIPSAAGELEELHALCARLHRDECEVVTIGRFYVGFRRFAPYDGYNPVTKTVVHVGGKRAVTGGFLAADEHP